MVRCDRRQPLVHGEHRLVHVVHVAQQGHLAPPQHLVRCGPEVAQDVSRITCPVYGFYGGNDNRVDSTIPKTTEQMKNSGKTYEPVTYEGAGHGFMRAGEAPDEKNEANKKARNEAWERWKELLKKL